MTSTVSKILSDEEHSKKLWDSYRQALADLRHSEKLVATLELEIKRLTGLLEGEQAEHECLEKQIDYLEHK